VTTQGTVARIGQGPVLAIILGATAIVGFGIGTWIGSQSPRSIPDSPAAVATLTPSSSPVTTSSPSASPSPAPSAAISPVAPVGPREILLEFSGTDHDVSQPFEVVSSWQIHWQTDGTSIAIAVTGEQSLGVVVDEAGPASGVISPGSAGTFRLDVAANGPWSITIIHGEEPTVSSS
jgi:hypothetical protein